MKKSRFGISHLLFIVLFLIPVSVLTYYQYMVADDRYESTATLYITEESTSKSPLDLSLLGITNTGSAREVLILQSYIESSAMLLRLERKLGLRKYFSNPKIDYMARLPKDATSEQFHDYFLKRISVDFDDEIQLLKLSVRAFDRQFANKILSVITEESQTFIDNLNKNVSSSQLSFFEKRVKESEAELTAVKKKMLAFQGKHKLLTTETATAPILGTISALEQQIAQQKTELNSKSGVLGKNSPTLRRIRAQIAALTKQVQQERERLAGSKNESLNTLDAQFRSLTLFVEIRTLQYKSNLAALEQAQVEAARRLKFLTIVSPPTMPDQSLYPNRKYNVLTGAIIALMIFFISTLIVSTIREHA